MRNRVFGSITVLVLATVFSWVALGKASPQGQAAAGPQAGGAGRRNPSPPGPPHDAHDLNGVWSEVGNGGGGGAGSTTGAAVAGLVTEWSRTAPPMTPEGLAKMKANKAGKGPRAVAPALGNDPLGDANPPGLLRTLVYGRPIQFIQLQDEVVQLFEWAHFWRQIWTDGRKLPEDPDPLWYGTSAGKWDGDTFVIETVGLDSRAWLDEWGTPFSDGMKVEERWHRLDRDNMEFTIRFDDPMMYTKAWMSDKKMFRLQPKGSPDATLLEVIFAPMDEKSFNEGVRNPAGGVLNK